MYIVTINPVIVPRSPRTCEIFTDRFLIGRKPNAYEGTKTTNSLYLSERYSADFKQMIEIIKKKHLCHMDQHEIVTTDKPLLNIL